MWVCMTWMMAGKGIAMMGMQPRGSRVRRSRRCGLLRRSASASVGHTRTKTNAGLVAVVAVSGLILAGCGGTTNTVTSSASPERQAGAGTVGVCRPETVGVEGPGGGKIFYVDMSRPKGNQCYEVAQDGWSVGADPGAVWGCPEMDIPDAAGTVIGTGWANTTAIVEKCVTAGIAARMAIDYASRLPTGDSLKDWFLPSADELNQLCKYARNQSTTAASQAVKCNSTGTLQTGFAASLYWSSSQYKVPPGRPQEKVAWAWNFDGVTMSNYLGKSSSLRVSPVRTY